MSNILFVAIVVIVSAMAASIYGILMMKSIIKELMGDDK